MVNYKLLCVLVFVSRIGGGRKQIVLVYLAVSWLEMVHWT